jgi:DNA-binding NtrC family response regulator
MTGWILIFDEDVHTRLTIARVFSRRGFIVIETSNVADVFECADRLDLACVFVGVDAPERNGIALLSLLRESYPDLPVVVVADRFTGRLEARRHAAWCCLQRPISGAVMEEFVTELCSAQDRAAA